MNRLSQANLASDSELDESVQESGAAPEVALKRIKLLYKEIMGVKDLNFDETIITNTIVPENQTNGIVKNQYLKTCCTTLQELCFKCERYLSKCTSCNRCACENSNIVILKNQNYNKSPKRSPNDVSDITLQSPVKCTVPKPFSFCDKDNEWLKAREIKLSKMKDQLNKEIEKELKVRVRTKPVPKNTHLPLYNQMVQEKKELQEVRKERCREILSTTKPFNLHEKSKEHVKSASDLTRNEISDFKAKPLPKRILSAKVTERLKNRDEVRKMLVHERAKRILETSSSPFSQRQIPRSYSMVDISNISKENKKDYSNVKISEITKRLYVKKCNETMNTWNEKVSQVDTCKKIPQHSFLNKHTSANNKKVVVETLPFQHFPVRMSNAAHLRDKQIREEILARKQRENKTSPEKLRKEINKDMILKLRSVIPTSEREKEIDEKVKSYREWQEKRQEEYEKELKEIMLRVAEQRLLLERTAKVSKTPPVKNILTAAENESDDASEKSDSEGSKTDDGSNESKSSVSESHSKESEESHQTDATESKSL